MSGGKVQERPILSSGDHAPIAMKNRDGSLTLSVYYETTQNSAMGPLFQADTILKTERRIFIADPASLKPARDVIGKRFRHYDEPMLATMFSDARKIEEPAYRKGSLKFSHGWPANGSHLVCPAEECMVYDKDYIWYVPARGKHSEPMAMVIPAPESSHTPAKYLPTRLALLPVGIVSDVAINAWLVVASVTGQNIDL